MIRHFFRPSILIALSAAVVVGAVVVVFQRPPAQGRPTPLPVAAGDVEIVWLYPATNASSWERFVAAVKRTAERLQEDYPGLQTDANAAFPQQTTAVPEVSLSWSDSGPRFVFRWYKLTSDWKVGDWIEALLQRRPPPLALIGGSSSDNAREVAAHLSRLAVGMPAADQPLLLLTTATADRVASPDMDERAPATVPLTQLYPERTFRFCFTNRQMALAVSTFLWSCDDLRPDNDPAYMVKWDDDSYSRDLIGAFDYALHWLVATSLANQWAWLSGNAAHWAWLSASSGGGGPWLLSDSSGGGGAWMPSTCGIFPADRLPPNPANLAEPGSLFALSPPPTPQGIASSVGSYDTPNRYEVKAARDLLDLLQDQQRLQKQPLLILTGQSQPSRRFLRALIGSVPALAGHLVVATGDAISFSTVYRDRETAWNIQDLPFPLVFFCHHNPIDAEAGFRLESARGRIDPDEPNDTATTGTEDVLLFGDIVEALLQAGAPPCANAEELSQRLADVRLQGDRIVLGTKGVRLFDADGQRQSGTGEHVVCLRPVFNDFRDRLLPKSTIEVWAWRRRDWERGERGQHWQRCGEPLNVSYSEASQAGGHAHGGP